MKKESRTFRLVLSALMVAISIVLSIFSFELPFGGSITIFSMVPLVLIAQMYGVGWGMLTCAVYGLVQMVLGLKNFGYVSGIPAYVVVFLFDYVLAFAVIGLAGLTRKIRNRPVAAGLGALIGCVARFVCHFVSPTGPLPLLSLRDCSSPTCCPIRILSFTTASICSPKHSSPCLAALFSAPPYLRRSRLTSVATTIIKRPCKRQDR